MSGISFEAVVQPAREVLNTATSAATTVGGAGGAAVSAAVTEFEARVGAALEDFGLDAAAIEDLAEDARNALAALLSVKDALTAGRLDLEELLGHVNSIATQPLGVVWRGENIALIRSLWNRQEEMRSAALDAIGLVAGFLDTLPEPERDALREQLNAIDPRFGLWLDRA